jgi:uncharacterized protein (DUF736 family)
MSYDNTNTGALFQAPQANDKQPNYKGTINVEGKEYSIAGWVKTSQKGVQFLSLKVSEPFKKEENNNKSGLPF